MFPCTAGVDIFPCCVDIHGIVSTQLDVVRKLIADVCEKGSGQNYLIQHSAGSGKSNSIEWTAYRLASLHDDDNKAAFSSVVVVTDRTVLDAQMQETISGFDHTIGAVEAIGEDKNSRDLRVQPFI